MKLECLKLDLHSKLKFHELEFQKSGILLLILQTLVCCLMMLGKLVGWMLRV